MKFQKQQKYIKNVQEEVSMSKEEEQWKVVKSGYKNHKNRKHQNMLNSKNNERKQWKQSKYITKPQKNKLKIEQLKVPPPIQFTICDSSAFVNKKEPKFKLSIIKHTQPPFKTHHKVDDLKYKLSQIETIWTFHIKQYLNDSQFVEIYRKGKSLLYGNIQYGKSIIKYNTRDRLEQYDNSQYQCQIFSRAYFKLWEILSMGVFDGKQKQKINIGCVAEGPGGFIHALMDYRLKNYGIKDKYRAITLKMSSQTRDAKDWSYYKSQWLFQNLNRFGFDVKLSYGQTGTGDLLKLQNINYFAQKQLEKQKCYIVTGDGGIQCRGQKQLNYQEVFNAKLFIAQAITAIKIQQKGGKLILKIYDCAFEITKQIITLICIFYPKVRIIKPITSRPGNSQKYLLCENFIGVTQQQQKQLQKLLKFWTQIQPNLSYFQNKQYVISLLDFSNFANYEQVQTNIEEANNNFLDEQYNKLLEGINLVQQNDRSLQKIEQIIRKDRYKQQISYAHSWCKMYGIPTLQVQNEKK